MSQSPLAGRSVLSLIVAFFDLGLVKAMVTTITESAMRQHQSDIDHALVIKLLILNRISRRFRMC